MRRNNALTGQLVGKWMRMRATCSITFAPIFRSRSLIVANSALARGSDFGMADRTVSISQNAAVCSTRRTCIADVHLLAHAAFGLWVWLHRGLEASNYAAWARPTPRLVLNTCVPAQLGLC